MKKPKIREDTVREACLIAGFLSCCAGIWMVFPPAALIIGGALLIWIGQPAKKQGRGS
ncbi:hypothetical protein [Paenibacillus sp. S150]|uniref:hypothetical protein n=1 Tax=Paenibacillus sp. S150 TaxID=2749826 RepID=UPI001C583C46|nr:hypothetical protein [Paenibacillus sp. S150]MBW4083521.1 hypothetical protein [Paenibacillus sp. S150]